VLREHAPAVDRERAREQHGVTDRQPHAVAAVLPEGAEHGGREDLRHARARQAEGAVQITLLVRDDTRLVPAAREEVVGVARRPLADEEYLVGAREAGQVFDGLPAERSPVVAQEDERRRPPPEFGTERRVRQVPTADRQRERFRIDGLVARFHARIFARERCIGGTRACEDDRMDAIFVAHAAATFALTGLVWVVQLAVYPLFLRVGAEQFVPYHAAYTRRVGFVVAPLMLVEVFTGVRLMSVVEPGTSMAVEWTAFILIVLVWASTIMVQVPLHKRLERGYDEARVRLLVNTNWLRTVAWSLRAGLIGVLLYERVAGPAA
jgi:hypothetical protein